MLAFTEKGKISIILFHKKRNFFLQTSFEKYLIDLFKHLNNVWSNMEGKMKSEAFKVSFEINA
jgi:hypothetical protein